MLILLIACAGAPIVATDDAPLHTGGDSRGDSRADSRGDSRVDSADSVRESSRDSRSTDSDTQRGDSGGDTGGGASLVTGPCARYASAVSMGTVDDSALNELSGLAVSRQNPGILWTHEDSGGAPELYALDATGATIATLHVDGVENHDWEDIAVGPCDAGWCLAIGEIGTADYDHAVLIVEEPLLTTDTDYHATPEVRPFDYPDEPQDAEGLALFPDGTPLIVTKRSDATAGLYALQSGATTLTWLADIATGTSGEDLTARATAADLSTDGATLLVRTYLHLYAVDVTVPTAPGTPDSMAFALELQGEAVAWDPLQGGFWQVGEGIWPKLYYTGCAP